WRVRNFGKKPIDGVAEEFPRDRLEQIFVRPGFQRARAIDCIISSGNDDDLRRLELLPDRATNLKAIGLWHQQIAQNNFRSMPNGEVYSGVAVARFQDF